MLQEYRRDFRPGAITPRALNYLIQTVSKTITTIINTAWRKIGSNDVLRIVPPLVKDLPYRQRQYQQTGQ